MSVAPGASRQLHLRVLGLLAGGLFGAAGVLVPFGLIFVASVLTGMASPTSGGWIGLLLAVGALAAGVSLSMLWLHGSGFRRAGRVTAAAGAISVCAGWVSMVALTPVLALLQVLGITMPDTAAMSLLPWLAALLGAIAGLFLWPPFARSLGTAPAAPPTANPATA